MAVATPCWPAPVSAITRVLPIRLVSSAWPSTLRILWAPVWLRSSRLSRIRAPDLLREPLGDVERARQPGVLAQDRVELGDEGRVGHRVLPGDGQLVEGGHERLGHEAAAPAVLGAPEPALVVGVVAGRPLDVRWSCPALLSSLATACSGSPSLTSASPTSTTWAPCATKRGDVVAAEDAGLGDLDPVVRDQRREPAEGVAVDLEGLQVAGVDADQLGAQRRRARSISASSWTSTSTVRPSSRASSYSSFELVVGRARRRSAAPGRRRRRGPRPAGRR